jgi:hypothetical protein
MRLIAQMLFLAAACLATRAFADATTPVSEPQSQPPPLSIWRLGDGGDADQVRF